MLVILFSIYSLKLSTFHPLIILIIFKFFEFIFYLFLLFFSNFILYLFYQKKKYYYLFINNLNWIHLNLFQLFFQENFNLLKKKNHKNKKTIKNNKKPQVYQE